MDSVEKYMIKYSDEELIALVLEKNSKALKILYERYHIPFYNFVLRYTNSREVSEDILQETFTRVWFASHLFNSDKGSFKTWLFTIGINITRNEMIKKRYTYQYVDFEEMLNEDGTSQQLDNEEPESILETTELKDAIGRALEKLNPYLKEVILLKHYNQMKFREIAEITNTPEGTLKARFHHGIAELRKLLQRLEY
jgi:RNA polymerase sigma-70 factor (ECF subfamily)